MRDHSLIIIFAAAVLFIQLGTPRLWDRDEPRNAGCAAEMLAQGDWVVPTFNAELRTQKPALLYWFMMTAYGLFGVGEFAARFWSAVFGVGTVMVTYHIGRRLFGSRAGLWAGLILASSLMFVVAGRAATPDSLLIFFSTLGLLIYVLATFRPTGELRDTGRCSAVSRPVAAAMYGLMGVAVLAKGPVGLVLPTAIIGMFLLIVRLPERGASGSGEGQVRRRWPMRLVGALRVFAPRHFLRTCWSMRPLTALVMASAVALPWYIWVGLRTDGAWPTGFFMEHHVGRTVTPMEGHQGGPLYYFLAAAVGFFPWSVFFVPVLIDLVLQVRRGDRRRAGLIFVACWVGVYIALFSIPRTKLPSYITPAYPALALATGCFVDHWTRGRSMAPCRWLWFGIAILAAVGVLIVIAVPIVARRYLDGDAWLGAIGLIPLTGAIACGWLMSRQRLLAAAAVFTVAAGLFVTTTFGFAAVRVDGHRQDHILLEAIFAHSDDPHIAATSGCFEPSWVFYAGRPIRELQERAEQNVPAFLNEGAGRFVILPAENLEGLEPYLPNGVTVLARARRFLREGELCVLGRPD